MALFAIQLVRFVLQFIISLPLDSEQQLRLDVAIDFVTVINQMLNVIII